MLKVEGLNIKYGAIHAVKGIDLEVNEGEIVTLIGANGAGKTSILKALSGLVKPSAGTITYDGKVLNKCSAQDIMKLGISHVPEGRRIFAGMTVLENLELGAYQRKDKDGIKRDLEAVYDRFPILKDRSKQNAATLSGGEQQRVQLARLLVQLWEPTPSPKWLFLDEPTSALDIHHQQHLFRLLRQLVHERQFNVCCVLHDLNLAARYADRVVLMQKGKVIANGKPQDVLTQQALTMLYGADITVLKDPANHSPLIVLDH